MNWQENHMSEQQLSRSLSRLETQDIKTQPQFNHYLKANTPPSLKEFHTVVRHLVIIRWFQRLIPVKGASQRTTQETTDPRDGWIPAACPILSLGAVIAIFSGVIFILIHFSLIQSLEE